MHVVLYKYLGEKNRVDKSSFLSLVLDTTGTFKASVSILNPTLLLTLPLDPAYLLTDEDGDEIDEVALDNGEAVRVLNFNYFYIEEFRRYYYLTSFIISSNQLATITGVVDPLFSFKDGIIENEGYIERNELDYDPMLEDGLLPLELTKEVTEETPLSGGLVNCNFQSEFSDDVNYKNFICTFVNAAGAGKVITAPGDLPSIDTTKFGDSSGNMCLAMDQIETIRLATSLLGEYSSYNTFFKGLVAYPINLRKFSQYPTFSNVTIYKEDLTTHEYTPTTLSARGCPIPNNSPYLVVADFPLTSPSDFLELNPYTHYEIYLPFYGFYEVEINQIGGHRLLVYYSVSFESGSGEVYLYDYTDQRLIFSSSVQLGIPIALPSTNAQELLAQKNAAQLNMIMGLIGSGIGLIGSAATGNALGVLNSGFSAAQAVTGYINQTSLMFHRAQTSHNGTAGGLYSPLEVRLRITRTLKRNDLDMDKFAHQYGRPLREIRKLNTLSGFTLISSIHLEGLDAFDAEKAEIEASLLSGVLL